ncbi:MAG: hypothetical protein MR467_04190 [Bacillales bacterium]|nr:hypothetical protein [Mollicutes bacterium]MCI7213328.1 hypothetical protein [Bacillales bacterium]MDY4935677.1 hypothetical protein [Candidatus Enteromonas sp.]
MASTMFLPSIALVYPKIVPSKKIIDEIYLNSIEYKLNRSILPRKRCIPNSLSNGVKRKTPIARERTGVSYSSFRLNLVLSNSSTL